MTKHTPRPWYIETHGDGHRICALVGPKKIKATIAIAHGMKPDDAYLMAASPELLNALRTISVMARAWGLSKYKCEDLAKIADAAIAKAEGAKK